MSIISSFDKDHYKKINQISPNIAVIPAGSSSREVLNDPRVRELSDIFRNYLQDDFLPPHTTLLMNDIPYFKHFKHFKLNQDVQKKWKETSFTIEDPLVTKHADVLLNYLQGGSLEKGPPLTVGNFCDYLQAEGLSQWIDDSDRYLEDFENVAELPEFHFLLVKAGLAQTQKFPKTAEKFLGLAQKTLSSELPGWRWGVNFRCLLKFFLKNLVDFWPLPLRQKFLQIGWKGFRLNPAATSKVYTPPLQQVPTNGGYVLFRGKEPKTSDQLQPISDHKPPTLRTNRFFEKP